MYYCDKFFSSQHFLESAYYTHILQCRAYKPFILDMFLKCVILVIILIKT